MRFVLIGDIYADQIIEALEVMRTAFKERAEKEHADNLSRGVICAYDGRERIFFDEPVAMIRSAERVGLAPLDVGMGPPLPGESQWLLLPQSCQRSLVGQLRSGDFGYLADAVESASTTSFPECHSFTDATGHDWEIIGWSKEDAQTRIEKCGNVALPVEWTGSYVAMPMSYPMWRGKHQPGVEECASYEWSVQVQYGGERILNLSETEISGKEPDETMRRNGAT